MHHCIIQKTTIENADRNCQIYAECNTKVKGEKRKVWECSDKDEENSLKELFYNCKKN